MGRWPYLVAIAPVIAAAMSSAAPAAAARIQDGGQAARPGAVAGSWGRAIEVPGLGILNAGGFADAAVLSCASAGNCAAGGYYSDGNGLAHGFVVSQRNGRWHRAVEVPRPGELNKGGFGEVDSLSCASAGNCAAAGRYPGRHDTAQGFVVSERNGVWGRAIKVPGLGALSKGAVADLASVSCTSGGYCTASGTYDDQHSLPQIFVVSERNGVWGRAVEVPGLGALSTTGEAELTDLSCASAGNCATGGYYAIGRDHELGFVVSETNGRWGRAIEVPGLGPLLGTLSTGRSAQVQSVSCGSAGNCAAGGFYGGHGFVVSEDNGAWGRAIEVPGLSALGGNASAGPVSCASAGNCVAGGFYAWQRPRSSGFLVSEKNGVWGQAIEVPGLRALNTGRNALAGPVSCPPTGNCVVSGAYSETARSGPPPFQGFVS